MTEAERQEMRTIYRDAADKTAQLGILVDMYQVSVEEAAEVCGCEVPAALQRFKPVRLGQKAPRGARIPPEEKRQAVAEVMAGKPAVEIADRFGVQVTAVKSWVRQAKRAGQEEYMKKDKEQNLQEAAERREKKAADLAAKKAEAEAACARLEAENESLRKAMDLQGKVAEDAQARIRELEDLKEALYSSLREKEEERDAAAAEADRVKAGLVELTLRYLVVS